MPRTRWPLLFALALTVGVAGVVHAGVGDDLLAGCEALCRGRWEEAEASFERAWAADATCAEALVGRGAALLQTGRVEEAAGLFQQAALLAPELAAAYAGLGACGRARGETYDAMIQYRRALGYAAGERAPLRASAAWLACRLGLYQSAVAEASAAVAEDPCEPLARHVLGAALLALGRAEEAVAALGRPADWGRRPAPGILAVPSALMSPDTPYWAEHGLGDQQRLAWAPQHFLAQPTTCASVPADGGEEAPAGAGVPAIPLQMGPELAIIRPQPGSVVTGSVPVAVETDGSLPIRHIALLLDDRFIAISNVLPFHGELDTCQAGDGLRELRVEGYGDSGQVLATARIMLQVSNGARTLAPTERAARRLAREELARLLSLCATPLTSDQLLGRALEAAHRPAEAVAAYEYVFSHDALLPGIRADLLLGYRALGLGALEPPHEIYLLGRPGAIALTFDDGPHPVMTPWILDLLDRYGYRATFFLVGKQAAMYPGLVREIAERGHELGSHSHTHCNLCTLDRLGVEQELVRSRAAIRQACGRMVTLFRPPGGNYDQNVRFAAAATGFTPVFWTENIGNYPGAEGASIAEAMDRKLAAGGIVLLHNGYDETEFALPHLLRRLSARGARCDTISALAGAG
ncbi:MAG: polysaccharide deacetylase family protein [Armatimonadota bacterium]